MWKINKPIMFFVSLIVVFILGGCAGNKNSGTANVSAVLSNYNKQSASIGYLNDRFIELQLFTIDDAKTLLKSQQVAILLLQRAEEKSIGGQLDAAYFAFTVESLSTEWLAIRSVLDRYADKFPTDVAIIYDHTRTDVDELINSCTVLLNASDNDEIDWDSLEKYGGKLYEALGPLLSQYVPVL